MHQSNSDVDVEYEWTCPICDDDRGRLVFTTANDAAECGVRSETFRPSANQYGSLVGSALRCEGCGHASLEVMPDPGAVSGAYADAHDEVSLREEAGQVETAARGVARIEEFTGGPGRLLDVGCWTGSFLVAARTRGWTVEGVEPSTWAATRARKRGVTVHVGELDTVPLGVGSFDAVAVCDVLEHLAHPGVSVDKLRALLRPGGVLYVTVPDAGSRLARAMGGRWWAIVPMHLQYFTRQSMRELLVRHGFDVRSVDSHPKVFSARYYAERFGSFVPVVGQWVEERVARSRFADRLVAPDFGDRLEMIAVRR